MIFTSSHGLKARPLAASEFVAYQVARGEGIRGVICRCRPYPYNGSHGELGMSPSFFRAVRCRGVRRSSAARETGRTPARGMLVGQCTNCLVGGVRVYAAQGDFRMHWMDYVVLLGYFVVLIAIGIWSAPADESPGRLLHGRPVVRQAAADVRRLRCRDRARAIR